MTKAREVEEESCCARTTSARRVARAASGVAGGHSAAGPPLSEGNRLMPSARRFPPPWSVEETDACFIVRDANGQALAYVYLEEGARSALGGQILLTREEARRIAANIAKLPEVLRKVLSAARACVYSITLSARARKDSGMVSPSALAVFRLTTRSNLVGCSTGRSSGLMPRGTLTITRANCR